MNGDGYYLGTIGCGKVSFYTIMISGESYSNKISAIIPDSLEGIYYLHLFTDFTNEVFEFQQENNNTRGAKIIIKNPDLIVDSIDVINSASSGNNINLSWIIKNQGEGKVFNKNRKDLIWLSRNPVYNRSNMIRVDSLTYCTSISNGATTTKQKSIKIPDGLDGQVLFIY
ncbi:MAG: hypothetical protein IPI77_18350 [Saprospiraceae bacterium]|nr:hypothetical protein [Saprospiraceae bacterium]